MAGLEAAESVQRALKAVGKAVGNGLVAAALAATLTTAGGIAPAPAGAITENQLLFIEAWKAVDRAYVDKTFNGQTWFKVREKLVKSEAMDSREETYDAIRKLLGTLNDPFTRFLDPTQLSLLQGSQSGSLSGVGLQVAAGPVGRDGQSPVMVVGTNPGSPAEAAGLVAGDEVTAVEGQAARGLSIFQVADLLQGPSGSTVTVEFAHAGDKKQSVTMSRAPITLRPVTTAACRIGGRTSSAAVAYDGDSAAFAKALTDPGDGPSQLLGIVRIANFNANTAGAVREALKGLDKAGAAGVVLDMRGNAGGSFPAGLELAKMFINKGVIVYIADSSGVRDIVEADGKAIRPTGPLTVLVNTGTASAAEVVTGALRDSGRALVLGERTFGKGLIQTTVSLSDGSGVNVTVAKYQTPSGTDINKVGIVPDGPLPLDDLPLEPFKACRAIADAPLTLRVEQLLRGTSLGAAEAAAPSGAR